jgi:hypothetical protein
MKSFESWLFDDVESAFQIELKIQNKTLSDWLQSNYDIKERQKESILMLKDVLFRNVNTWNEDELKMQFIGPLLSIVNYNTDKYKAFTQRSLTLKTETIETSGLVDFMIATGKSRPKEPFFFLHEYKSQHPSRKNDPLGQLLIAMVAAHEKNSIPHPIYGVLVEGRFWYFVVLHQKEYSVSRPYDAGENDIYQIFAILCKVKDYIEEILARQEAK